MSNFISSAWSGAWDSIKSPMNVLKSVKNGDFSGAWKNLKAIPGNQERANSKTLNSAGIRGWVGDHPGESAAAIVASIFGGSALAAGGGASGAAGGAGGSSAAPITAAVGTPTTGATAGTTASASGGSAMSGATNYAAALQGASSILSASNSVASGQQQAALYQQQAGTLRKQANNVNAASQIQARSETDKARQAESTALANAAASGGGASDVDVINNIAGINQQGQLNNMMTLWSGEQQANQLKNQASVMDVQAQISRKAGKTSGLSSILGGATSIASLYR